MQLDDNNRLRNAATETEAETKLGHKETYNFQQTNEPN